MLRSIIFLFVGLLSFQGHCNPRMPTTKVVSRLLDRIKQNYDVGAELVTRLTFPSVNGVDPMSAEEAFDLAVGPFFEGKWEGRFKSQQSKQNEDLRHDINSLREELFGDSNVSVQFLRRLLDAELPSYTPTNWLQVEKDNADGLKMLLAGEARMAEKFCARAAYEGSLEAYERLRLVDTHLRLTEKRMPLFQIFNSSVLTSGDEGRRNNPVLLGVIKYYQGDIAIAKELFLKATAIEDIQAYKNLGFVYELEGDIEKAKEYYMQACLAGSAEACDKVIRLNELVESKSTLQSLMSPPNASPRVREEEDGVVNEVMEGVGMGVADMFTAGMEFIMGILGDQ